MSSLSTASFGNSIKSEDLQQDTVEDRSADIAVAGEMINKIENELAKKSVVS